MVVFGANSLRYMSEVYLDLFTVCMLGFLFCSCCEIVTSPQRSFSLTHKEECIFSYTEYRPECAYVKQDGVTKQDLVLSKFLLHYWISHCIMLCVSEVVISS